MSDSPTPAAAFRSMRETGVLQTLPSGRVVRLRTVTPDRLLRLGKLPNPLRSLMLRMVFETVPFDEVLKLKEPKEQVEEALEVVDTLNVVCEAALLEPSIGSSTGSLGENQISVDDLTLAERGWIFELVFMPAEALATFRWQPEPDVGTLPNGQNDGQPTEPVA